MAETHTPANTIARALLDHIEREQQISFTGFRDVIQKELDAIAGAAARLDLDQVADRNKAELDSLILLFERYS